MCNSSVIVMAIDPNGAGRLGSLSFPSYRYAVLAADGREVLGWHLHGGAYPAPHLHLGLGPGNVDIDVSRAHVPSGIVLVEEFIRFLIRDLGGRSARPDWEAVLASLDRP